MFYILKRISFKQKEKKRFLSNKIIPFVWSQKINNEIIYVVHKKHILLVLQCLNQHIKFQYKVLSCISGVDFLGTSIGNKCRFGVVYDLLSIFYKKRIRVKLFLKELDTVSSTISIYINANWWEREIWDMFGIWFENHIDLRRILTDYGFGGYPLRKDFPLTGYIDVCYDIDRKRIISKPLQLSQEYRLFVFEDQW